MGNEATGAIAGLTGLVPRSAVPYGSFVYIAFYGLNLAVAKQHPHREVLLSRGEELSLMHTPNLMLSQRYHSNV